MPDKISVYGGTGFVGSVFSRLYADDVIVIPREERQPQSNNIVYFLSTTSNYNVFEDLHLDINTNLNVLMEVLEYCKDTDTIFNYISTGFVYGNDILDSKETDPCDPKGFYSITKRAAEQLLVSFCETFNVKYRIIRSASIYGHDKTQSNTKNVLGHMVNLLKEDKPITLYDNGEYYRDYMHVEDVSRAIRTVMDKGEINSIYNIGAGSPELYREIILLAKQMLLSKSEIISVETPEFYRRVQAKNFTLNVNKLRLLGFQVSIPLQDGLDYLCFDHLPDIM
jgi:nucleoside-diphosphate-sugar epimerase